MAEAKKNSLVNNINKKKKAGTSNSKSKSTITKKAYDDMKKTGVKKREL
jgi:hypothetical protein